MGGVKYVYDSSMDRVTATGLVVPKGSEDESYALLVQFTKRGGRGSQLESGVRPEYYV